MRLFCYTRFMQRTEASSTRAILPWDVVILLGLLGIFIAAGISSGPLMLLMILLAVLFSFRYINGAFYWAVALVPFLGAMISFSTGDLMFGKRAFGGSIDATIGEIVFFVVLIAWVAKMYFYGYRRQDIHWRPTFPLLYSYGGLFVAHLLSIFSPYASDPVIILKYSLRPVLFCYLAYIALAVNLIRSRRRLMSVLTIFSGVGSFVALNGLFAMFFPQDGGFIGRARPFPIFGVSALGENHNALAEFMVVTVPFTLALARLVKRPVYRRLLWFAAGFQFLVGLLSFTRTLWIVFAVQVIFLFATEWKKLLKNYLRPILITLVFLIPLAMIMGAYAVSYTARSSNTTRQTLIEISLDTFRASPIFGTGAGSFVDRVGSTRIFLIEFGDPLDSHGWVPKIAAETGLFGLLALAVLLFHLGWIWWQGSQRIAKGDRHEAYWLLVVGAAGGILFQMFSTSYWTGKMWLPIGITLAALELFIQERDERDILPE
jgi:O-antigen ligase